jgi:hypothetical protein
MNRRTMMPLEASSGPMGFVIVITFAGCLIWLFALLSHVLLRT